MRIRHSRRGFDAIAVGFFVAIALLLVVALAMCLTPPSSAKIRGVDGSVIETWPLGTANGARWERVHYRDENYKYVLLRCTENTHTSIAVLDKSPVK